MAGFLILGATGSVGSHLARRLVGNDCRVFIAARNADRLEPLASELDCPSGLVDASDPGSFIRCFEETVGEFGEIAGVANCIGSLRLKPAHMTTDEEFHAIINANLFSAFATARSAGQTMNRSG